MPQVNQAIADAQRRFRHWVWTTHILNVAHGGSFRSTARMLGISHVRVIGACVQYVTGQTMYQWRKSAPLAPRTAVKTAHAITEHHIRCAVLAAQRITNGL